MQLTRFKIIIRNLLYKKYISTISIVQLIVAFTAILSIFYYVSNELSYDKFHKDYKQKYLVYFDENVEGFRDLYSTSPIALGTNLIEDFPEVEAMSRIYTRSDNIIETPEKKEYKDKVLWADSTFYEIFDLQLITGEYKDILNNPDKVCISNACAAKYFGNEDPIGKSLIIDGKNYNISGIFKKYPKQSHLSFDIVASIISVYGNREIHYWDDYMYTTYIKLRKGIDSKKFESKLDFIINERLAPFAEKEFGLNIQEWFNRGNSLKLKILPVSKIRLYAHNISGYEDQNSIFSIYIFIGVAILITMLTCLNFINFNIGNFSINKAKFGVKKTLGAHSKRISSEIFHEVFVIVFISSMISLFLMYIIIPFINQVFDVSISYNIISLRLIVYLILFDILFSVLGGFVPSLSFSGKKVNLLLNKQDSVYRNQLLKHGLLGFQFMITIFVLIGFIIINKQLRFVNNADLGFNDKNILIIKRADRNKDKLKFFIDNLQKIPNVHAVTELNVYPSKGFPTQELKLLNGPVGFTFSPNYIRCDENLKDVLQLKLIKGKWFSQGSNNEIIINEKLAQTYNIKDNPLGQTFTNTGKTRQYEVVGVFNNINFKSLHKSTEPLVLYKNTNSRWTRNILVKLDNTNKETLDQIKKAWNNVYGGALFEYTFLDDEIALMYKKENLINKVITFLSVLTLVILIIGLLGATYMLVGKKIKEIGVRKVNGAKISEVLALINKDFLIWFIVAFTIVCPVGWYLMSMWLDNFAYKTNLDWWIFALAGTLTLVISLITVNWQSWQAARKNPVEALRYE